MQNEMKILEEAVLEIAAGNKDGIGTVYERLGRLIYSVALGITGECRDSEDVLQDTMIELLECAHTYKKGTNPRAFILTLARHNALDTVRKRRETLPIDEAAFVADEAVSDAAPLAAELLSRLDDEEREIILLRIYGELSFAETAKIMGISIFAAQKRYQRVIKKLKKYSGGILQ